MSEFVRFTADPDHNREEIDRITDALQRTYGGRVFSVTYEARKDDGVVELNVSIAHSLEQNARGCFQLGRRLLTLNEGIEIRSLVEYYRGAIRQLEDREEA